MSASHGVVAARKTTMVQLMQRWLVRPPLRLARAIERRSQRKLAALHDDTHSSARRMAQHIRDHDAAGTDAAAACTRQYLRDQSQLLHYRVVRCADELRHLLSGAYFRDYGVAKLMHDLRFATQAMCFFLVAVLFGRGTIFPPIAPDSPFVLALQHKTNPN